MQKLVNIVNLVKSFPTNIYFQKSASIEPRTSLSKIGGDSIYFSFASLVGPVSAVVQNTFQQYVEVVTVVLGTVEPGGSVNY